MLSPVSPLTPTSDTSLGTLQRAQRDQGPSWASPGGLLGLRVGPWADGVLRLGGGCLFSASCLFYF